MTAFNVVRIRVKADCEASFVEMNRKPGHEVKSGLRRALMVKTGERTYCFIGEWNSMKDIVNARPDMIEDLNRWRPLLEDLGGGLGVTDAISGEAIAENVVSDWSHSGP
jgi:hypothetical protein